MGRLNILMHCGLGLAISACELDGSSAGLSQPDTVMREYEHNGFRLNGFRLNGFRLNGFRLNGALLGDNDSEAWIALERIVLADESVAAAPHLVGGELRVEAAGGEVLSGLQLTGAVLEFTGSTGAGADKHVTRVRIDEVTPLDAGADLWLYDLAIQDDDADWEPLCVDAEGEPTQALLLGDVWDPDTGDRVTPRPSSAVTFACRDAALGKCALWGYAPWRSVGDVSLADHHQACTRAVRADYCGDGKPHTADGLSVHFTDDLAIQEADLVTPYLVEAEWGPDGAACLNPDNTRMPNTGLACGDALPSCGDAFASGGLVQTGVPAP